MERPAKSTTVLAQAFIRTCQKRKRGLKIADSTGIELSGGSLLMRTMILRRLLVRHVLAADEPFVGLLLPPSVGAVLANMAVMLDRRVPVNLNYSVSSDIINECIQQAGIKHVLTSRRFMEKMQLNLAGEIVYLEDLRTKPTFRDKLCCALGAYLAPATLLERIYGLRHVQPDDLATVVFTSGSTGRPKGVMLTQQNIGSNIDAIQEVINLAHDDVLVGVLPFFHSFGFTITLWTTMALDIQGVFHYSPLDGKQIGKLCQKYGGTVLLGTPTFLRTYLRRCEKEEFASLDVVIAGAEKLPRDLADAFEQKFGIRPYEGYGTTELSPLVSVNIPPSRSRGSTHRERKEGTVGRPVPEVTAKITDLDTGAEITDGRQGMLWIRGPNVMKGYLNRPDLTAEVVQDGWYMTGDVARLDVDGFIEITGRESRFSKIGGEMVPHIRIEEVLAKLIGTEEEEGPCVAVTAVADPTRGERLVVLHTPMKKTPDELREGLKTEGLPCLYVPSTDSFREVEKLPVLGSGKLDLRGVKKLAGDLFGS